MKLAVIAASVLAFAVTAAGADPREDREAFMKQNGRLLGAVGPVVKGERPFDAGEVLAALEAFNAHAQMLDADKFFPEGSEGGEAAPAVWSDRDGFHVAIDAYKTAASEAVAAAPQDVAALRGAFGKIGAACGDCHETFRIED